MGEATMTLRIAVDAEAARNHIDALALLARAIDAMSRADPHGVTPAEWDAIIAEGKTLIDKAVL